MYHSRFTKSHYEGGYHYGSLLYKNHIDLNHAIEFAQDETRRQFAKDCIPIYQAYFPEILQEIKGIAEGAHVSVEKLHAFLFGMYCFTMDNHCTCMACANDETLLFGRNSDFLVHLEKQYDSCYYNYKDSIPFIGQTTAFSQMEDGINAYGLAIGLTFICPTSSIRKPGFQAGMVVRFLLETCKTVKEAVTKLKELPLGSAQTLTMMDTSGDMIIIECNSEKLVEIPSVRKIQPFLATANHFRSNIMEKYNHPEIDNWRSEERFHYAYKTLQQSDHYSFELIQDILSGKYGFMCQYDRSSNADTVWSCIYDLKQKKIYRCEGNPSRKQYKEDHRLTIKKS